MIERLKRIFKKNMDFFEISEYEAGIMRIEHDKEKELEQFEEYYEDDPDHFAEAYEDAYEDDYDDDYE
jgi:hypothetical protein